MNFLSARWENLLLANYEVHPECLQPFVPNGTSIDTFDGKVFVSLVAFEFNRTRIFGIPIPFHINFPEVNLRFYVKPDYDPSIRAVTFIKEIVSRTAVVMIANKFFHENYERMDVAKNHDRSNLLSSNEQQGTSIFRYRWGKDGKHFITGKCDGNLAIPPIGSMPEFVTEHYYGFAKGKNGSTIKYDVKHPQWKCRELNDFQVNVDFQECYGEGFGFLNDQEPYNVLFARGSEITVSTPSKI